MPKKAGRKAQPDEPDKTTTKVEVELLNKARIVAIRRGEFLFDYIDAILRATVEKDYRELFGGK